MREGRLIARDARDACRRTFLLPNENPSRSLVAGGSRTEPTIILKGNRPSACVNLHEQDVAAARYG